MDGAGEQPSAKPYQDALERFDRNDKITGRTKADTVFFGSSSIELWQSLEKDFKSENAINRGISGSLLSKLDEDIKELVVEYKPSKTVLYAGTNDLAAGHSAEQVVQDFEKMEQDLHKALPNTDLYFISMNVPPVRENLRAEYERANKAIKEYCDRVPKTKYIDMTPVMEDAAGHTKKNLFGPDRLHPTKQAYALWKPIIEKAFRTPE